jgi:hemerythrin-like metal-binding protein
MYNSLYINWTEENNIGIKIIDEQHRGIISAINSLYYFIQIGHKKDIIQPTIITLEQYIKIHFYTEEALMKEAGYPDIAEHVRIHQSWIKESKIIFYEALNNQDTTRLLKFLKDWWMKHIQHEDTKYIPYMKKLL